MMMIMMDRCYLSKCNYLSLSLSLSLSRSLSLIIYINGGARDVMVIVLENRHGDTSSNPGRD